MVRDIVQAIRGINPYNQLNHEAFQEAIAQWQANRDPEHVFSAATLSLMDSLAHGAGDAGDLLQGGTGNGHFHGLDGNDTLAGDDGADILDGGAGNDLLSGDAGNDALWGDDAVPLAWSEEDDDMLVPAMYGSFVRSRPSCNLPCLSIAPPVSPLSPSLLFSSMQSSQWQSWIKTAIKTRCPGDTVRVFPV